jgi:Flp pilus assembly protein TadG
MRGLRKRIQKFRRTERGAAIVEFALVIPFFFLLVWGGLVFSRAYQRLGVLKGALREGARVAATFDAAGFTSGVAQDSARARIARYTTAFGFTAFNAASVNVVGGITDEVTVSVTDYQLFNDLTGFFGLNSMEVSDTAVFRWERSP